MDAAGGVEGEGKCIARAGGGIAGIPSPNGKPLRGGALSGGVFFIGRPELFFNGNECHVGDSSIGSLARGFAGARRKMGVFLRDCAMSCGGRVLGWEKFLEAR